MAAITSGGCVKRNKNSPFIVAFEIAECTNHYVDIQSTRVSRYNQTPKRLLFVVPQGIDRNERKQK